jgi:hypothetical protein
VENAHVKRKRVANDSDEATRALWLFATLWSLREYPTRKREWSFTKKFSAIRAARFDGVMSPPRPEIAERGSLRYLAIASVSELTQVRPALVAAHELGALAITIQLGRFDTSLNASVKLAIRVHDVARELALPFAIETHRGTFTETPEKTLALCRAFTAATREKLPLCLDHSHFALVRHVSEEQMWARLREPTSLLAAAEQFHLRPFNGHHAQLAVLDPRGRRTPEYRRWLDYSRTLLAHVAAQRSRAAVLVVPELGHAAPSYRLSCFGDTWDDTLAVARDLRRQWRDVWAR